MQEIETRVLDAINVEGMLACLCDLISVRSLSGAERPAQEEVAAQLSRFGFRVDTWELDFEAL